MANGKFEKPFSNVESVELSDSLSGNFNMRLICTTNCNPGSLTPARNFPNLEHLEFIIILQQFKDRTKSITAILRLNP